MFFHSFTKIFMVKETEYFSHCQAWSKQSVHCHANFPFSWPRSFQICYVQWLWLHAVWAADKGRDNFAFAHPLLAYVDCIRSFFIKKMMLLIGCSGWFMGPVQCGFFDVQKHENNMCKQVISSYLLTHAYENFAFFFRVAKWGNHSATPLFFLVDYKYYKLNDYSMFPKRRDKILFLVKCQQKPHF